MNLRARISSFFIVVIMFLTFVPSVFAWGYIDVSCTDNGKVGVNTALGCVPVQLDDFITWLLPYLFGIGGGIAFLLMIYGFILMTTSNGDPKAVQGAKETITSAIVGLLISIFAIFILRLITVDILHIPGLSY